MLKQLFLVVSLAVFAGCDRFTGIQRFSDGKQQVQEAQEKDAFFDVIPGQEASYIYAPGMMGSEVLMGRYSPKFTAVTGEKVSWAIGGHTIGHPHSCVIFPEIDLRKPTCFTLNPLTYITNCVRKDLFPLAERFFGEKYGIKIEDNPESVYSVSNYGYRFGRCNIGQAWDIKTLNKLYHEHKALYPATGIVLYGDSRGAATIFSFIAQYKPQQVKAAVLEAPFDTVGHCIKHLLYDDKDLQAEERLHSTLSFVMGKYKRNGINPRKSAEIITDDIPLLLVTSLKDGLVAPQCTIWLYKRLKQRGFENVHLLVLKNSLHPTFMLNDKPDKELYETVTHAFYKHYGLPHNKQRAAAGAAAFKATRPSLQEVAKLYPLPTCELCKS